jgi:GDP-L-fucose synthase
MIRKFHEAKQSTACPNGTGGSTVKLWGSGTPMREFLHVNDLADSVVFALENHLSTTSIM